MKKFSFLMSLLVASSFFLAGCGGSSSTDYTVIDAPAIINPTDPADTVAPVITLTGATPVTITVGDIYEDAGATASDDVDGDITAKIITVSTVNNNVIGAYTVTYNVSDAAANAAATVTRTVNVISDEVAGEADATQSTYTATLITVQVYQETNITVTLRDSSGIALTQGGDVVTLQADKSSVHVISEATDHDDGTYTFTVTLQKDLLPLETKKITYAAVVNGVIPPLPPYGILITYTEAILEIGDANATTSIVDATTPVVANGTAITTITVTLKDSAGTSLIASGGTVTMAGTGDSNISAVTDNGNGTYTATATNNVVEIVTYTAELNTSEVIVDTAIVEFTDPNLPDITNPLTTVVAVSATGVTADGATITTITVTLVDGTGTQTGGGHDVTLISSSGTSTPSSATNVGDGTYTFTAYNTVAETVTYTAVLASVNSTNTATVEFVAGAADVAKSTVTASPAQVESNGIAIATITVTLVDANGNMLTTGGDTVTMSSNPAIAIDSTNADNGDGTYTFTATHDVNNTTVTFTATLVTGDITATAEVLFTDNPVGIEPASYVGKTIVFDTLGTAEYSFYKNAKFVKVSSTGVFEFIGTWNDTQLFDANGDEIIVATTVSEEPIFHFTMINGKNSKGPEEVQGFALREKLDTRVEFIHFSDPGTLPDGSLIYFIWMYGYDSIALSSSDGHAKGTWNAVDGKIVATLNGAEFQTYAFDRGSVTGSIVTVTNDDDLLKVIVIDEFYELQPGTELDYATEFSPAEVVGTAFDGKMMTVNSKVNGPASRYFEQRAIADATTPIEDQKDGYVDGIIWAAGITAAGETWGGKGDHWNTAADYMSILIKVHYDGLAGTPEKLEFDNGTPVHGNATGMARWEESARNSGNYDVYLGTTTLDQVTDF